MTDDELALTELVGRALVKAGLDRQAALAREHYRAIRAGRPSTKWSRSLSIEWLRVLQVPPYENDYPVRPRMSGCTSCDVSRPFTVLVFPGGTVAACACGARWVERDKL